MDAAAGQLAHRIELASRAMVALGSDLQLELSLQDESIECSMTPRRFLAGNAPIEGVAVMEWNGERRDEITLHFAGRPERGVLSLYSKSGSERHLLLLGYPAPISVVKDATDLPEIDNAPYPQELAEA